MKLNRIIPLAVAGVLLILAQSCKDKVAYYNKIYKSYRNYADYPIRIYETEYPDTLISRHPLESYVIKPGYAMDGRAGHFSGLYVDVVSVIIMNSDTVDRYGLKTISLQNRYICRYDIDNEAYKKLPNSSASTKVVRYPPTQSLVDAGVRVVYPDGRVWQK